MFIMVAITIIAHWIIPILLIGVLFFVLKKNKKLFKAFCIIIVALTVFSYFSVGVYSKSTISGTVSTSDLSKFSKDKTNYFYKGFDGGSCIYGEIHTYNKKDFSIDSCVDEFGNDVSSLNKKIMKSDSLSRTEVEGDITVKYSPVIMSSKPEIFFTRDRYFGYVMIEQNNSVIFIEYKMVANSSTNAIFFNSIYSKNLKIEVKDIFNSVLTEKEYSENL